MSQETPAKHDRIERHLQRQRGAGVRNIGTSFGFSFGLQAEQAQTEEPPAKRHKSAQPSATDRASASERPNANRKRANRQKPPRSFETIVEEAPVARNSDCLGAAEISIASTRRHPVKDDAPEKEPQTIIRKRGRPKKAANDVDGVEAKAQIVAFEAVKSTSSIADTVRKRGRPKKLNAKFGAEGPTENALSSAKANVNPSTRRSRLGSKHVPPDQDEHTQASGAHVSGDNCSTHSGKRGRPMKSRAVADQAMASTNDMTVGTVQTNAATVRKVGRPVKRVLQPLDTANAESAAQDWNAEFKDLPCNIPAKAPLETQALGEPHGRRPQRQAAATAMLRVTEGLLEEERPIEKQRRDPDMQRNTVRRVQETVACSSFAHDKYPVSRVHDGIAQAGLQEDNAVTFENRAKGATDKTTRKRKHRGPGKGITILDEVATRPLHTPLAEIHPNADPVSSLPKGSGRIAKLSAVPGLHKRACHSTIDGVKFQTNDQACSRTAQAAQPPLVRAEKLKEQKLKRSTAVTALNETVVDRAPRMFPGEKDGEQDVDWLTNKVPNARPNQRDIPRRSRPENMKSTRVAELDLDDLLSTVATFVPAKSRC